MKKAIYTVILNNYDSLRKPRFINSDFDYICFTDNPDLKSDHWQIRLVEKQSNPIKQQREIKILPHKYLPEYDLTVYIDGSHQLTKDVNFLIQNYLTGNILLKKHPSRICIYKEGQRVIELRKDKPGTVNNQLEEYRQEGIPENLGLYEDGFIIRKNAEDVNALMESWMQEIRKHSHRDQISLPVILYRAGYSPKVVSSAIINTYFIIHKHNPKPEIKIWHATPGRADKNIGKAYNDFCDLVPDNDWICLRDQDSLFWPELALSQMEDIIREYGDQYALFGATTNRLNSANQRPFPEDFYNMDVLHHRSRAEQLYNKNYGLVREIAQPVAGLFMLFRKSTWNKVKFVENSIYCDSQFGNDIMKKVGKIAIMEGVYTFHYYRAHAGENAIKYKKHLVA